MPDDSLAISVFLRLHDVTVSSTYTGPSDAAPLANLPDGLLLTETDPLGRVTQYQYDTTTVIRFPTRS
jgi:hypothetical protein